MCGDAIGKLITHSRVLNPEEHTITQIMGHTHLVMRANVYLMASKAETGRKVNEVTATKKVLPYEFLQVLPVPKSPARGASGRAIQSPAREASRVGVWAFKIPIGTAATTSCVGTKNLMVKPSEGPSMTQNGPL